MQSTGHFTIGHVPLFLAAGVISNNAPTPPCVFWNFTYVQWPFVRDESEGDVVTCRHVQPEAALCGCTSEEGHLARAAKGVLRPLAAAETSTSASGCTIQVHLRRGRLQRRPVADTGGPRGELLLGGFVTSRPAVLPHPNPELSASKVRRRDFREFEELPLPRKPLHSHK